MRLPRVFYAKSYARAGIRRFFTKKAGDCGDFMDFFSDEGLKNSLQYDIIGAKKEI